MKKILIGYLIDGKKSGIDKYLLNVIDVIRKYDVEIDCLTNKNEAELKKRLDNMGVGLINIPTLKHPIKQYKEMIRITSQNNYDVAYFNISEAFNCIGILAAKKNNVDKVIVHSHSSGVDSNKKYVRIIRNCIHNIAKKIIVNKADVLCACSDTAAMWMFSKTDSISIINNAVDLKKFKFDKINREIKRRELGIENRIVVGHVGAFSYQKNSEFLVDLAFELKKINANYVILSIGDGTDLEKVKGKAVKYNVEDNIIFLGVRSDVDQLLSAMDVFVLPSRFEGLPIAAIEAQAVGLPIVMSDTISRKSQMVSNCKFLSIKNSASDWANIIDKFSKMGKEKLNQNMIEKYDLSIQKKQILDIFQIK